MSNPADLLGHPEVVEVITRILRRFRVRAQDLSDAVADVQERVLKSLRLKPLFLWPKELPEWKRLAVRSTKHHLIDRFRKAKRRKEAGDEGVVVSEPDTAPAETRRRSERDPLDQAKGMALIDQLLKENPNGELWSTILDGLCDDKDQGEIARETGLPHQKIRDEARKMRRQFQAVVASALGAGSLIAALALVPRDERVGAPNPHADIVETSESPPELTPEQQMRVDSLRATAHQRALEKDWARCFKAYLEAERLDPRPTPPDAKAEADRCKAEFDKTDAAPLW